MKKNIVITVIIIIFIIPAIMLCFSFQNWKNKFDDEIIPQMEKSLILKEKIGVIEKIKNKYFSSPKIIDGLGQLEYRVVTNKDKYDIIVVFNIANKKIIVIEYIINNEKYHDN